MINNKNNLPTPRPEKIKYVLEWTAKLLETEGWTNHSSRSLKKGRDVLQALDIAVSSNYSRGLWFASRNILCEFLNVDCLAEWNDKQTDSAEVCSYLRYAAEQVGRGIPSATT